MSDFETSQVIRGATGKHIPNFVAEVSPVDYISEIELIDRPACLGMP